ncbi:MAG TPA: SMC-Scp complex subunit ScpB [Lacipirellulaceae bacterium]|jgi:segregation and condensation protein B|nr:SMC-Scp complex subunit ScpB [Lacipirellulaceae bacterium]
MRKQTSPANEQPAADSPRESPLSLNRLREAFAAMMGRQQAPSAEESNLDDHQPSKSSPAALPQDAPCEISPRSVVESILFVGRPDNGSISSRELAAAMRGVSPAEVDSVVNELNAVYQADQAPYWIEQSGGGYQLALRPEFERVRDKFYGRIKEARLPSSALEVLSVLAYNQPATAEHLNELRGQPCGAALAILIRRQLVRLDRSEVAGEPAQYSTTERFLRLFGLETLSELPRSEELDRI